MLLKRSPYCSYDIVPSCCSNGKGFWDQPWPLSALLVCTPLAGHYALVKLSVPSVEDLAVGVPSLIALGNSDEI
jgi:hypothetical protein